MTALSVQALNKSFGSLIVAQNIAFDLPSGARYALIGPNGAGKTTLVNLITGALAPDSGRILLDGEDVTGFSPAQRVRKGLARTFQINSLFARLTPLESVTLAVCERTGVANRWWSRLAGFSAEIEEASEILSLLRLIDCATRLTSELAYGERRLLEIALALATSPGILLLDEPAAGVPKEESAQLFKAIESLSPDLAILFIEHDMNVVFRFAAQVVVMAQGRILVQGSPAEIARDAQAQSVYLGKRRHG